MSMYSKAEPYEHTMKAGETVYICQCGHTGTPPFCDGSHKQHPGKEPHAHTAAADETLYICGCGKSDDKPWCDGSHNP
jgi:CDGSH iron-sulfur domain-containing protein 3